MGKVCWMKKWPEPTHFHSATLLSAQKHNYLSSSHFVLNPSDQKCLGSTLYWREDVLTSVDKRPRGGNTWVASRKLFCMYWRWFWLINIHLKPTLTHSVRWNWLFSVSLVLPISWVRWLNRLPQLLKMLDVEVVLVGYKYGWNVVDNVLRTCLQWGSQYPAI